MLRLNLCCGSRGEPGIDEREKALSRFDTDCGLRALLLLQGHAEEGLELRRRSTATQEATEATYRSER
jgi:hypothetical protein